MSGPVNSMTRNPTFSPYAIDDPTEFADISMNKGLPNPAYENCAGDQDSSVNPVYESASHHYENPSHLKTNTGRRQKQSPIYETATPRLDSTKYQDTAEPVETYRESRLSFVILFVILVISIIALILVILIIMGKLGPGCSCSSQTASQPNTAKRVEDGSSISLRPVYDEINALKENFSTLSSQLNQKILDLQKELNDAKKHIQFLQKNTNAVNIAALWVLANTTKDQLQSEATRLQKAINDTIDKCNAGETKEKIDVTTLQKAINDTIDKCNAGDAQLTTRIQTQETKEQNDITTMTTRVQTQETKEQNDVTTLQKNINDTIDKCNAGDAQLTTRIQTQETKEQNDITTLTTRIQTQETKEKNDVTTLQTAIDDSINKCKNVNSTLSAKIDAVSKMQGPRGYNGSQGLQGPQGPSGAGNLTQCIVENKFVSNAKGKDAVATVKFEELPGKKIVHFSCSSNIADTVEQVEQVLANGHNEFICKCKGQGYDKTSDPIPKMICYLWYTECPLIS